MGDEFWRQYEQQWKAPLSIPADARQPWLVMGDNRAIRNVMSSDYYAGHADGGYFETATGKVYKATHRDHIRGHRDGTLFVLLPPHGYTKWQMEMIDEAMVRGFAIRDLPTKRNDE